MRRITALAGIVLLLGSCRAGSRETPEPPSSRTATPASTSTPAPTPPAASPSPPLGPGGIPTAFAPDLEPADVPPEALIPEDAITTGTWFAFTDDGVMIVIAWVEDGPDPTLLPRGLAVWRRAASDPHWRLAFVRRHGAAEAITEIQATTADVTGDRSDDALVFEGIGGSGACGSWLVIDLGSAERVYRNALCDGRIDPAPIRSPGLILTESVFRPGDAHCCPSAMRRTSLTWTGSAWRVTDRSQTEA